MRATLRQNVTCVLICTVLVLCVVILSKLARNDVGMRQVTGDKELTALDNIPNLPAMDSKIVIDTLRSEYLILPPKPNTPLNLDNPEIMDSKFVIDTLRSQYLILPPQPNTPLNLDNPEIMDSKFVIDTLRSEYLILPPQPNTPLNLDNPEIEDRSEGQALIIREILNDQKDGFFIECGAFDGESLSNTLVLERELNWTGLLIEADPKNVAMLVKKRRNAFVSPTCLSPKPYSMTVSFHQGGNGGQISDKIPGFQQSDHVDVKCFPLFSYLLALNKTTIDYFSLDVEGHELEVLENIPFDKVNIRTLTVEWNHVARGKDVLQKFMEDKGYTTFGELSTNYAADIIFHKL